MCFSGDVPLFWKFQQISRRTSSLKLLLTNLSCPIYYLCLYWELTPRQMFLASVESSEFKVQRPESSVQHLRPEFRNYGMPFGRVIWDKLPECIFENFEITQVKQGQFQNFQKSRGSFIPKIGLTKRAVTG